MMYSGGEIPFVQGVAGGVRGTDGGTGGFRGSFSGVGGVAPRCTKWQGDMRAFGHELPEKYIV